MTFSNKPHFLAVVSSVLLLLIALTVRAEMDRYIVKVMPVPGKSPPSVSAPTAARPCCC